MRKWLRISSPAVVTLVLAMWGSGVLFPPTYDGLPTTPVDTLALIPVVRVLMFVLAAVALGLAAIPAYFEQDLARGRRAAMAAFAFSGVSAVLLLLTLSDIMAVSVFDALDLNFLVSFTTEIDEGRYLALQVLLGIVAGWIFMQMRTLLELGFGLLVLTVAAVLPGFTGHSTASVTHWIVSSMSIIHLSAMLLWVSGVVGLLATGAEPGVIARYSNFALAAYIVIVLSGVGNALVRVASWSDFFHDRYALVLLAKVVVVLVLGVIAHRMRGALAATADGPVARRLLGIEASLLFVVIALAVTLARMANP